MYPPIHPRPEKLFQSDFSRLDMLWDKYPQFQKGGISTSLEAMLSSKESYRNDFRDPEIRLEYLANGYERFLIRLSWNDLHYRQETRRLIEAKGKLPENPYIKAFMRQFSSLDTDRKAYFLFPESCVSGYFTVREICKNAESVTIADPLFPDEDTVHYLAVFDKQDMDDILLMFHILYGSASDELFGGYKLYSYSLPWYYNHLCQDGIVLRSPYLPDRLARYQGYIQDHHNPSKTVYVRRNIDYMLEKDYIVSELEFFLALCREIMPVFQWWYTDIALYETQDGIRTDWRFRRTEILTRLTAEGTIKPKWKSEVSLFNAVREEYPDTLYQYRPEWLARQSLDIYIPSIKTAIEYQGVQHYKAIDFFGGEEALKKRRELDDNKRRLCGSNGIRLIEWPYDMEPDRDNIKRILQNMPLSTEGSSENSTSK